MQSAARGGAGRGLQAVCVAGKLPLCGDVGRRTPSRNGAGTNREQFCFLSARRRVSVATGNTASDKTFRPACKQDSPDRCDQQMRDATLPLHALFVRNAWLRPAKSLGICRLRTPKHAIPKQSPAATHGILLRPSTTAGLAMLD